MKRRLAILLAGCLVFLLVACSFGGNSEQPSQMQETTQEQEQNPIQVITSPESNETEQVEEGQEQTEMPFQTADTKPVEKADVSGIYTDKQGTPDADEFLDADVYFFADGAPEEQSEMKADELIDLFISGSINAVDPTDSTSTFYITDLNMDSEEWDAYSVGEKIDLDNDGENELILNGPYGGIYLDARDGQVYGFAAGEGDGFTLSYTYFKGAIWILYSNRMHQGYESYHMELFEGADNLVEEMNFNEELIDEDNVEGPEKYYLNGTEITYDEYLELSNEIFDAQVTTN